MKKALSLFKAFLPPASKRGGAYAVSPLPGCADAFLALTVSGRTTLAITAGIPECEQLVSDLSLLSATLETRILEFPPLLPGDKASLGQRLKTVAALKAWKLNPYPLVIAAPFAALSTPLPSPGLAPLTLEPGSKVSPEDLAKMGYRRTPQIEQEGDFSIRGGILDVWSPGEELPVRAEFFGDELESLRLFDAATQISVKPVKRAAILPIVESSKAESVSSTLFDLLPESSTILAFSPSAYSLPFPLEPMELAVSALPGFAELGAEEAHHPELFEAARQKLERHLDSARQKGAYILKEDALSSGFEIPGLAVVTKADRVFAKRHHPARKTSLRANADGSRLNTFEELEPGEYVVHVDYGVGKYTGSHFIDRNGEKVEVFTVEYADGAKLHVPAAHAHLLSRYVGVKGMEVKVHKLDGKRWSKDKADAQKAIQDFASQLLSVQAKREIHPGIAYEVEGLDGLAAFEAAFPYEETPDQAAAIEAVKSDMHASKPMDRLVCGDAGYGKTEVAMRAAFIAAMNGRQVAVLAPTTVLAEQHFETFTSRFDGTPIRIESVSRFQSAGVHSGTFKRLATGACDIVIGTHAILSPQIAFRDLGLVIIDEEQRFGVRQKEFLKALRATADILTLSATPIPRTLYLSMTGARDLSLLRTPPRERVAVETKIEPASDALVQTAISRELESGGQVFFLHNRVSTIGRVEKKLKELLPQAKIIVAHGQMDARTLARKMRTFERGEADILLSTTIVESGIDIPRANTIIVDHAEMFGLAELYQLRGRVGRSAKQGHAYFLLPSLATLDSDARERLAALKRHGGLGSGFNLALRDLELRGAGNILGRKQSGHIANIGFSLYCQLLQRTIAMMKGEKVRDVVNVQLDFDFPLAAIPYEYVEDEAQRLSLFKRFAEAQDLRVVKALSDEMRDRFGPLPTEVQKFVKLAALRIRAASRGIGRITVRGKTAKLFRADNHETEKIFTLRGTAPEKILAELFNAF
jgi:transcription-repair coupling factor (superfamily II helicase)